MPSVQMQDDSTTLQVLQRAREGDLSELNVLLDHYRGRLRRMVRLGLNRRLARRIDPSDVIQDAFVEVSRVLPQYLRDRPMPFFLWLRQLVGQKMIAVHRRHLGAQMRSAGRELSVHHSGWPEATSATDPGPSQAAIRQESKLRLERALESMESIDREVLTLRHFEQLSNGEAAHILGLSESASSKRYMRALGRLASVLVPSP